MKRVAVIGLWHQGVVGAACLADAGYSVRASGAPQTVLESLRAGKAPIYEPGLDAVLAKVTQSGQLRVEDHPGAAVEESDLVLLMHDTPVDDHDLSDLSPVWADVDQLIPSLKNDVIVYVTAQVPVGTCDELAARVRSKRPDLHFGVAYSPENLRLGQAIERFRNPPLPVVGADEDWVFEGVEALWSVYPVEWHRTNLRTAEMVKHGLNTFLAATITLGNELGNLCDEVGADGHRLAEILRLEPRVGSKAMLLPGLGFAGGTLARDVQTLRGLGDRNDLATPLLDGLWESNRRQNNLVLRKLEAAFDGRLSGRKIAILGITYKPDTSTLRRSAAIEVAQALRAAGADVCASDPKADRQEIAALSWLQFDADPYVVSKDAHAVVLMTPWKAYGALNPARMADIMRGKVVLDTANMWKADDWIKAGFTYLDIGRGRRVGR